MLNINDSLFLGPMALVTAHAARPLMHAMVVLSPPEEEAALATPALVPTAPSTTTHATTLTHSPTMVSLNQSHTYII